MLDIENEFKLNSQQIVFVREMAKGGTTQIQCAILAGYSPKWAGVAAQKLLARPQIKDAIRKERERLADLFKIDYLKIMKELESLAFCDIKDVVAWNDDGMYLRDSESLPKHVSAAIKEISMHPTKEGIVKRIKMHDKTPALQTLNRIVELQAEIRKAELEIERLRAQNNAHSIDVIPSTVNQPQPAMTKEMALALLEQDVQKKP